MSLEPCLQGCNRGSAQYLKDNNIILLTNKEKYYIAVQRIKILIVLQPSILSHSTEGDKRFKEFWVSGITKLLMFWLKAVLNIDFRRVCFSL